MTEDTRQFIRARCDAEALVKCLTEAICFTNLGDDLRARNAQLETLQHLNGLARELGYEAQKADPAAMQLYTTRPLSSAEMLNA